MKDSERINMGTSSENNERYKRRRKEQEERSEETRRKLEQMIKNGMLTK